MPIDTQESVKLDIGGPIFVGTASGLIANLKEVAEKSPMKLGTVPACYEMMRNDLPAFMRADIPTFSEEATCQWVWRAFFDGASIALRRNQALWSA